MGSDALPSHTCPKQAAGQGSTQLELVLLVLPGAARQSQLQSGNSFPYKNKQRPCVPQLLHASD